MTIKKIIPLIFLFSMGTNSQQEFEIHVKNYLWNNDTKDNIDLIVLFSIKNIGSEAGYDDDLNKLYLTCSQSNLKFGKDIQFIKFNNSINQVIQIGEEKLGYIIFNIPKAADDIKLTVLGGDEKFICKSYYSYTTKDASIYQSAADDYYENKNYSEALVNYLKANCINPYLHLNSKIDSIYTMFTQTEQDLTYSELFSDILVEQSKKENTLKTPDIKQVKLKADLDFCNEYRDGKEIGTSNTFFIDQNGGYITIMIKFNRKSGIDKIDLKIVKEGLLFDITTSEQTITINPDWESCYISNAYFHYEGIYKVTVYHSDGRQIGSNKVQFVLKK